MKIITYKIGLERIEKETLKSIVSKRNAIGLAQLNELTQYVEKKISEAFQAGINEAKRDGLSLPES